MEPGLADQHWLSSALTLQDWVEVRRSWLSGSAALFMRAEFCILLGDISGQQQKVNFVLVEFHSYALEGEWAQLFDPSCSFVPFRLRLQVLFSGYKGGA